MKQTSIKLILLALLFSIIACGIQSQFNKAGRLESKGLYLDAIKIYKSIYNKNRNSEIGATALYNTARVYHRKMKIFSESTKLYNEVIGKFSPDSTAVKLSKTGLFDSPNYFPFNNKSTWIEGDSQTGGKNMRIEWYCTEISTYTKCFVQRKFFAGTKLAAEVKRYFAKDNFELQESLSQNFLNATITLKYPFETGKTWISERENRKLKFTIMDNNATVKVRAGEFSGCLKIREQDLANPLGCKYDYYAPEIGHILTSIGTSNSSSEYRNNELISYTITPD